MNQLAHQPFCPEARALGIYSREFEKYARCTANWARFFATEARKKQEAYEEERKEFLLEEARKNRKLWKPRKRNLIIKSVAETRREAFQALIEAGLSAADAKRAKELF